MKASLCLSIVNSDAVFTIVFALLTFILQSFSVYVIQLIRISLAYRRSAEISVPTKITKNNWNKNFSTSIIITITISTKDAQHSI